MGEAREKKEEMMEHSLDAVLEGVKVESISLKQLLVPVPHLILGVLDVVPGQWQQHLCHQT